MAERKVLNKYYAPDYDPEKIRRLKVSGGSSHKVRLMAPFSMRCNQCGNYIYKGKKFNARKEIVKKEDYLGIQIYRFYIRCPTCANEVAFKTDPKNADYKVEMGASRNFEPWRQKEKDDEERSFRKQLEEELDPMKKLENITEISKREIEISEALDEIRTRNARAEKVNSDLVLDILAEKDQKNNELIEMGLKEQEKQDEEYTRKIFEQAKKSAAVVVKTEPVPQLIQKKTTTVPRKMTSSLLGIKKKPEQPIASSSTTKTTTKNSLGLVQYESDSE